MESAGDMDWGWYTPQQIPELIAWLGSGSEKEQCLAEDIYGMYQPVLHMLDQVKLLCLEPGCIGVT